MITKVAFIGSKALGLTVLQQIFLQNPNSLSVAITLDDSQDLRSDLLGFNNFCKSNGIPLEIITKNSELQPIIMKYRPQLCLVVGWYWMINKDLLNLVPNGWLGIHASLLPMVTMQYKRCEPPRKLAPIEHLPYETKTPSLLVEARGRFRFG